MELMRRTWIGPEEDAYPEGTLRASRRRGRAMYPDGVIRSVTLGIPDTFFTIPASGRVHGTYVGGFVTVVVDARDGYWTRDGRFPGVREGDFIFVPREPRGGKGEAAGEE